MSTEVLSKNIYNVWLEKNIALQYLRALTCLKSTTLPLFSQFPQALESFAEESYHWGLSE